MNQDKKSKLAKAYVKCRFVMQREKATIDAQIRVEDIMLASIRTLDFIWEANADKSLDYILESILRHMAFVAAEDTGGNQDKIYIEMIS